MHFSNNNIIGVLSCYLTVCQLMTAQTDD